MFDLDGVYQGAIVTVTSRETSYDGEQGRVVEICMDGNRDGPIGVMFRKEQMAHHVFLPEEQIVRFLPSELQVDADWSVTELAIRTYREESFFRLCDLRFPFDPQNVCMYEECSEVVIGRAMVNVWGTIIRRDLCLKHYSQCHGWYMEHFPSKLDWKPVAEPKQEASP